MDNQTFNESKSTHFVSLSQCNDLIDKTSPFLLFNYFLWLHLVSDYCQVTKFYRDLSRVEKFKDAYCLVSSYEWNRYDCEQRSQCPLWLRVIPPLRGDPAMSCVIYFTWRDKMNYYPQPYHISHGWSGDTTKTLRDIQG